MADSRSLLIKSSDTKTTTRGSWAKLKPASSYIAGIETGETTDTLAEIMNSMVTGIPSIWARTRLFQYAFEHSEVSDKGNKSSLMKVYKDIVDEWKGLIGLMAIYPDRISIKNNIVLDYRNDDLFTIPGAFGRMLLDDIDLWCDPEQLSRTNTKDPKPFIQLIYYNDILIGATSPYTLAFTAVDYSTLPAGDIPWYRNGKFEDPLKFDPSPDNLQRILIFTKNIMDNLPGFFKDLNRNRGKKEGLSHKSLLYVCEQIINEISKKGIVAEGSLGDLGFAAPFYKIFNYKQTFYFGEGRFTMSETDKYSTIDPQKLLMDSESIYLFSDVDSRKPLSKIASHLLQIESKGQVFYAPLPLSNEGLRVFFHHLSDLLMTNVSGANDIATLTGFLQKDKLKVELRLKVDGKSINPITKEYSISTLNDPLRSIMMWPGFVSKDWNQYYLYSEYPSNHNVLKAVPFYKKFEGFKYELIVDEDSQLLTLGDSSPELKIDQLVKYPVDTASATEDWPYEIIRSNQPIAGVELKKKIGSKDISCGFIVVKRPDDSNVYLPVKELNSRINPDEVTLGIDFGSNNTAIGYCKQGDPAEPLKFMNQRRFLLGIEVEDVKKERPAIRNELLFFQNEEPQNGQIKSWIHEHKNIYVQGNQTEEISGGVPVFEPNILIHDMDTRMIKTNAGVMHYNTKWLTDVLGNEKKQAFLRSVAIMAAASLFAENKKITKIRWSYPGSFSENDVRQYARIFSGLHSPYSDDSSGTFGVTESATEAEAVANYVLNNRESAGDNLLLGIDVGGSTSDIIIIAGDLNLGKYVFKKQSSLRLASGILADVILKSARLRDTLLLFHKSADCPFKIAGIETMSSKPQTSPYYLNAILDRLQTDEDFRKFYWFIAGKNPEVFTIPLFLSGLLLFYSGKLVASVVNKMKPDEASRIQRVDFFSFGKGGRIFEWLYIYPGAADADKYYKSCFKEGLGDGLNIELDLSTRKTMLKDNKLEVAKGLTADAKIKLKGEELNLIRKESDIIGEQGYKFRVPGAEPKELLWDTTATDEHFNNIAFALELPKEFVEFNKFLDIFLKFTSAITDSVNTKQLDAYKKDVYKDLLTYITSDSEYIKAMKDKEEKSNSAGFRHSLLIYEGMCFLKKYFIPNLFK